MMDRRFVLFAATLIAAFVALPLAAPSRAAGEVTQTRPVSGFDRIRLSGVFTTEVTAGAHETRVTVTADSDVIGRITTEVRDGTLVVGVKDGTSFDRGTPKLAIALPKLVAFSNDGAGAATITGLTGSDFAITNSGAASITASGRAARETISLNGAGKIDTTGVDARDVSVDNNGVGTVHVRASGSLVMSVNGVGEIRYTGNPSQIQSHINGIGRIGRL